MRTPILTPSAMLLVALASGCGTAAAAARTIDNPVRGVAGNCPAGTGPVRPATVGASADRNHDGYGCLRRGTSIAGDNLLFEIDNDATSAGDPPQRDPVWDALYTGM